MYNIRTYKFRIYPDAKRLVEIDKKLILAQQLYNKILERIRSEYEKEKNSDISMSTLNSYMKDAIKENREFLKLYSQTRQDIFIRIRKAFQNFFRRVKEKKMGKRVKVGFPRFKSRDKYKSLTYPQDMSFSIERKNKFSMLRVPKIGRIKINIHRNIEGKLKRMTIKKLT